MTGIQDPIFRPNGQSNNADTDHSDDDFVIFARQRISKQPKKAPLKNPSSQK